MVIIANAWAGHGRGRRLIESLRSELARGDWRAEILETRFVGHAAELAAEAARGGADPIVVAGGDGTVSEVVQGLSGFDATLGLIPIGTGNDLARSLGIPRNRPARCLEILREGRTESIDVARVGARRFVSVLGAGFPSMVAEEANQLRRLRGSPAFLYAAYRSLLRMAPFELEAEIDGVRRRMECTSILVQNTPFTGGGLLVAPEARLADGMLDLVVVGRIGALRLGWNFPRLYWGGHVGHPAFELTRFRTMRLQTDQPLMIDGEPLPATGSEVTVSVEERSLHVLVGRRERGQPADD